MEPRKKEADRRPTREDNKRRRLRKRRKKTRGHKRTYRPGRSIEMKLSYRQILYALNSNDPLATIERWRQAERIIEDYGLKVGPVWDEQYRKMNCRCTIRREEDA
jgi:hypothetical protein